MPAETVDIPKRIPLVISPENRAEVTTQDSKIVNAYSEKQKDGTVFIYKRPGLLQDSQPPGGAAVGRGIYNWLGDQYAVFAGTLYKNGSSVGSVNNTNGVYRFSSTLGATPKLQLGNGVKAYNYDSGGGLVLINDVDFPAAFVKGWCYLDGTVYVGTAAAAIQGSDINTPTSWDPLNTLTAQIEPDQGIGLRKQLVYVVFFKGESVEIFYDAGNATGSPLGAVQGAKVNYGCATEGSIAAIDGMLFWAAVNRSASSMIMKMDGLKVVPVSTPAIERLLNRVDFTTTWSFGLKNNSHRFYILTSKNSNITLAYDIDEDMWQQWTDKDGNYWPYVDATYDANVQPKLQHESNGRIYALDDLYFTDNGDTITVDIVTPNFDGETNRRKQMTQLKIIGDQVPGSILQIRTNDSDFNTAKWTNFRKVDMSQTQPMLSNCGTFVRRSHHLRHQCNTYFRIKAMEPQLDIGTL